MTITKKEIEHVANLSRLILKEEEIDTYTEQLNSILKFMDKLNEIDTTNIKPTSHAIDVKNVYREDKVRESIPREVALKNTADHKDGQFKVPQVMEG